MTTAELRAVAEEILQIDAPTYGMDVEVSVISWGKVKKLAEGVIAEYLADDDEVITREWLIQNGFTQYASAWPGIKTQAGERLEWRGGGMWLEEMPIIFVKNRGQLRRLVAALKGE